MACLLQVAAARGPRGVEGALLPLRVPLISGSLKDFL